MITNFTMSFPNNKISNLTTLESLRTVRYENIEPNKISSKYGF